MALTDKLTAIGNAIRAKSGKSEKLSLDQMPVEIANIQTGVELNFAVVGNPQPENPSENTIWVNTDTEITGWAFGADEPEMAEGLVWIKTGSVSAVPFNALKKNCVTVYPLAVQQFIGGAWVDKPALSYQNGEWVEWTPINALYYHGDECVNTSGGWNARGWRYSSSYTGTVVPSVVYNDDHMEITVPNSNTSGGVVEVLADQDLTNVNQLTIDFEVPAITGYRIMLIVIDRNETYMDDAVCSVDLATNSDAQVSRKTVTLDTSGVSGLYDVAIRFSDHWTSSGNATMKVYSVMKE